MPGADEPDRAAVLGRPRRRAADRRRWLFAPACHECSNGRDDDEDGLVDWPDDPDCASATFQEGARCARDLDELIEVTGPRIVGTTVGASNDWVLQAIQPCDDDDDGDYASPTCSSPA